MSEQVLQRCDNCQQEFPEGKIATHFGYCRRNIKKCSICRQMYDINFQEEHEEQYHKQEDCPHCKRSFPSAQYKQHQSRCDKKPKYCQYCDLNVPVLTYPSHLKQCESRTKPCTKCNRPITNKQYLVHLVSCQGFREEPKPQPAARNYQEHIHQQRRVIEHNQQPNVVNSRSRDKAPSYQYKPREEKQQKKYVPIVHQRKQYYAQPPKQEVKREEKRQPVRYPPTRTEVKKEEPKKYISSINPPAISINHRREEVRVPGRIAGSSQNQPSYEGSNNRKQINTGTRQAPKQIASREPVSNKDIFPSRSSGQRPNYGVKEVRSVEKKTEVPKRQEKVIYDGMTRMSKAPEVKTRVIYQSPLQPQSLPQPPSRGDYLQQEYALGSMDLGSQDHQLQMAIMQSMGGSSNKNSSYSFQSELSNPAFIAQQKAIEEQFKKRR